MKNFPNKIQTPRPYLSWSQFSLVEKSPAEYERVYIYGKKFENGAMKFGKKVAKTLENDSAEDLETELARLVFPKSVTREYELPKLVKGEYKNPLYFEGIPLFGRMDGFNPRTLVVDENKTGKTPWTQAKVDTFGQLTFYAIMVFAKHKKLPPLLRLNWGRTQDTPRGIELVAEPVHTFETIRTMDDVVKFYARMDRAWKTIQEISKSAYSILN